MDLVQLIIATFYEHVGQQFRDQTTWRNVVEDRHVIDVPERGEYLRTFSLIEDGSIRTFQLAHCSITVNSDQQRIAQRSRLREIAHMSDVHQIENAVSKNEPRACGTQTLALSEHLTGAQNLFDHQRNCNPVSVFLYNPPFMPIPFIEENDQTIARREHLDALRELVGNTYPNKFERSEIVEQGKEDTITAIVEKFRDFEPKEELNKFVVRIAGRIASPPRVMGKTAFVHLSDGVSRLQIYIRRDEVEGVRNDADGGEVEGWPIFQLLDHGDFIGVEGFLFITKTGELSVHVQKLQFLSKALVPMPDKMHGIHDPEIRQRQRYADLIAGSLKHEKDDALTPREVFETRAAVVRELRRILEDRGYIEVETPMLTPLPTGAAARPFKTHHNALDIDLYARIAPELYLKRLLVGGFEKVYELNRNFRNEGLSSRHNPEFTMLEFYWAYADVNAMMDFCEEMFRAVVFKVLGHTHVQFGEHSLDFGAPFRRVGMKESLAGSVRVGPGDE